jgi:hypothetical protein
MFSVPGARGEVVPMTIGLSPTVKVEVCDPSLGRPPPESVTWKVTLKAPATVGVPDSIPALLKVSPWGSVPEATLHLYGGTPPLAVSLAL